jgi:enoyl-CoA hydratase/long-chain 3-hydroxyacyl-CoA dehydrogenase
MQGGDPTLIAEMVKKGWLGRKSGKGFYMYPKDAKKGAEKQLNPEMLAMLKEIRQLKGTAGSTPPSVEDVQNRIMARFVNECVFCLQDGVIRAPADGTYTFF